MIKCDPYSYLHSGQWITYAEAFLIKEFPKNKSIFKLKYIMLFLKSYKYMQAHAHKENNKQFFLGKGNRKVEEQRTRASFLI